MDTCLKDLLSQPLLSAAAGLLGMKLTSTLENKVTSGMIVEVEAYGGIEDEASHAYRGAGKRSKVMFLAAGHCYVYLIYGMYHCLNVVTGENGAGEAVLIRAIEPLAGVEVMQTRRKLPTTSLRLTNGPGKLCQALGVELNMNGGQFLGVSSGSASLSIEPYRLIKRNEVCTSTRIGISKAKDLPWRFYLRDNIWVSRK